MDLHEKLEREIDQFHPSGLCPLCDCAMIEGFSVRVVAVHGNYYLCHDDCTRELEDETDDIDLETQP